ncbi:TPA: hypothetical protein N0F65_008533 [Lagenidium giganteum]|uniref:Uncharacterized protein n=1 Tax=Lagenidium giganteum TaxID=4803 RepID=A0AAV2Z8D1_9STRA|nr:TPA: hypothetical protein N0F65_008533 [Lagenidium giganteum]
MIIDTETLPLDALPHVLVCKLVEHSSRIAGTALGDIEILHTNLSVIPGDHSAIEYIPESLMRITLIELREKYPFYTLIELSLSGNNLEDVSVLAHLLATVGRLLLDDNPLRVLPTSFENAVIEISAFSAEHTLVGDVPLVLTDKIAKPQEHQCPLRLSVTRVSTDDNLI